MEWTTKFSYCLSTFLCCVLFTQSAPHPHPYPHPYYDQSFIRTNSSRKLPGNVEPPAPVPNRLDPNEAHHSHSHSHHAQRHSRDTHIHTSSGPIRGFKRNVFGKEVFVYYGIPFAEPPVDELRFKKPVPKAPWSSTLHAVHPPNSCYQEKYAEFPGFRGEEQWNPNTNVSEDCLYLNLWVPRSGVLRQRRVNSNSPTNSYNYDNGNEYSNNLLDDGSTGGTAGADGGAGGESKGLPILIWLYGGGYMSGTITLDIYNGDILAAENDVIVVAVNYRVGAFGFLYFGNEDAPGNQGMYDQVTAMRWVKENAASFGGDPNSITLFGESAGGGSVSFHMLSPLSRDLLTRGILQSGTLNAPWSVMSAYQAKEIALNLARDTECNETQSEAQIIACMRTVPAFNMSVLQWNGYKPILGFPFAPTVDGEFFPRHPVEMLKDGDFKKAELLIGSNKNEGTYFILYDYMQHFSKDGPNCLSRENFLEIINQIFADRTQLEREAILFQYNNWEDVGDGCRHSELLADVVGDYFFICPTNYFAQAYADHGVPVYYYFFTQRTSSNPWGEWMGVLHADEIEYVFGLPLNFSETHTVAEKELSRRVMQYFVRFALTGNPVDERYETWPMYTRDNPTYFILNADKTESGYGKGPRVQSCAFWNEFIPLITPGTSSLPSRCGRERWDMNVISSYQTSWTTKASASSVGIILLGAVCTQFLYSQLILSSSSSSWT